MTIQGCQDGGRNRPGNRINGVRAMSQKGSSQRNFSSGDWVRKWLGAKSESEPVGCWGAVGEWVVFIFDTFLEAASFQEDRMAAPINGAEPSTRKGLPALAVQAISHPGLSHRALASRAAEIPGLNFSARA